MTRRSLPFVLLLGLLGCEGPMGPAGPPGPQGEPGPKGDVVTRLVVTGYSTGAAFTYRLPAEAPPHMSCAVRDPSWETPDIWFVLDPRVGTTNGSCSLESAPDGRLHVHLSGVPEGWLFELATTY